MQNLPEAETYELEFKFMPWGLLIKEVLKYIIANVPYNGRVLDLMCGPGYLLGLIQKECPNSRCTGVDLESEFIRHAKAKHPGVYFCLDDATRWQSEEKYDVVICTAGVHHLPDEIQESFIQRLAGFVKPGGFAIVADPYIGVYSNPQERQLASAELGYEYLKATINNGAPKEVIQAALQVQWNDVMLDEWKTSANAMYAMLNRHFDKDSITARKTWPLDRTTEFGDHYFILRK
jgi:2-polyprenyl-3-methyl-5-hydroxy-6-metoxy-1,4-benzoquinol methylase